MNKDLLIRDHKTRSYKKPYETFRNYCELVHGITTARAYRVMYGKICTKKSIGISLRWEVWERDNFTCKHCGARRFLQVDHIIPESKGGPTELSNLQTLCVKCNRAKSYY